MNTVRRLLASSLLPVCVHIPSNGLPVSIVLSRRSYVVGSGAGRHMANRPQQRGILKNVAAALWTGGGTFHGPPSPNRSSTWSGYNGVVPPPNPAFGPHAPQPMMGGPSPTWGSGVATQHDLAYARMLLDQHERSQPVKTSPRRAQQSPTKRLSPFAHSVVAVARRPQKAVNARGMPVSPRRAREQRRQQRRR